MFKKTKVTFSLYSIYASLLTPTLSHAATYYSEGDYNGPTLSTYNGTTIMGFLKFFRTWILGFAGALAVLFVVIGGLKYVTSAGNEKQAEDAKKTLTFALIGLACVLLSSVILGLIAGDLVPAVFDSGPSPYSN